MVAADFDKLSRLWFGVRSLLGMHGLDFNNGDAGRQMKLRWLYAIAGGAWGVVLGAVAAIAAFGVAAGFAWLYLYGDSPWPAASAWVLPLVAVVAGAAVFMACVVAGYLIGRAREQRPAEQHRRARRGAYALLAAAALGGIIVIGAGAYQQWRQEAERRDSVRLEDGFAQLMRDRHIISRLDVRVEDGASVRVATDVAGERIGGYTFEWKLVEKAYHRILAEGARELDLAPGAEALTVDIGGQALVAAYEAVVLNDVAANVLVDEAFTFEAKLTPRLTPAERDALPPARLQNLALGYSELVAEARADVPVRFVIER